MSRHVVPHEHIFLILQNQSLPFPFYAVYLAEKQQMLIWLSLFWSDWGSNPRSITLDPSMLTITPPIRFWTVMLQQQHYFIEWKTEWQNSLLKFIYCIWFRKKTTLIIMDKTKKTHTLINKDFLPWDLMWNSVYWRFQGSI